MIAQRPGHLADPIVNFFTNACTATLLIIVGTGLLASLVLLICYMIRKNRIPQQIDHDEDFYQDSDAGKNAVREGVPLPPTSPPNINGNRPGHG